MSIIGEKNSRDSMTRTNRRRASPYEGQCTITRPLHFERWTLTEVTVPLLKCNFIQDERNKDEPESQMQFEVLISRKSFENMAEHGCGGCI
jgi:hypothetical protein